MATSLISFGSADSFNFNFKHVFTIADASADLTGNGGWVNSSSIGSFWNDNGLARQSQLADVCMVNSRDGWAVGNLGLILHWDGSLWQRVPSPVGYDLRVVSMAGSNDGWIPGQSGTMLRWNGNSWSSYPLPLPNTQIESLCMVSPIDGWAIGESWKVSWTGSAYDYQQDILRWDGQSWSIARQSNESAFLSIFMLNSKSGWVVGENGLILHWDGVSWTSIVSPTSFRLNEVFMLTDTDGWAVGANSNDYFMMANGTLLTSGNDPGTILHWDGSRWTLVSCPVTASLRSIHMVSSNDGWAVGEDILHWDGRVWYKVNDPLGDDGSYYSISMTGPNEGWIAGSEWVHTKVSDRIYSASPHARLLYFTLDGYQAIPELSIWTVVPTSALIAVYSGLMVYFKKRKRMPQNT